RTSLAYITPENRLKLLAPIKDYIQKSYPPSSLLYFPSGVTSLISLNRQTPALLHKFTSNISNIHFTLRMALSEPDPITVRPVVVLLLGLTHLYFVTNIGSFDLLQSCFKIIQAMPENSQLLAQYCITTYWTIPPNEVKRTEELCFECLKYSIEAGDVIGIGG
ncbi:hypothetical protein C8J56DRAFT_794905, partial [Mycena floridula]